MISKIPSGFYRGRNVHIQKIQVFWKPQILVILKLYPNLKIFGGFVAILTKKKTVIIFGTTLETTFL